MINRLTIDIEKAHKAQECLKQEKSLREHRWLKALEAKASFDLEMEMKMQVSGME